jgi:hypothetical protein
MRAIRGTVNCEHASILTGMMVFACVALDARLPLVVRFRWLKVPGNLAVLVGESFVFRFAKHAEAAIGLRREMALLPRLAPSNPRICLIRAASADVGYCRSPNPYLPASLGDDPRLVRSNTCRPRLSQF